MAISVASVVATCSVCGESLNSKGECLVCLIRAALDKPGAKAVAPVSLIFGDFEVTRREDGSLWELGRGAMGVTYLALDKVLRRKVALKVIEIPSAARSSQAVRERFLREARSAAALRHPNVAAVFQFGASPDGRRRYYAMELVEGETLETRVRRDGPLNPELALEIAIQVSRALAAGAAHGLIHRDLKPANLMLVDDEPQMVERDRRARRERTASRNGGIPTVKIIDFGLAKAIADVESEMDLTHGEFVGTPNFASPEQFGSGPIDVRSDIYSLGATLWFALTGKPPFGGGRTIEEIRRAQQSAALPIEQLKAARVPTRFKSLLKSMLAIEPAARPGVHELAARLRRCSAEASGVRRTSVALTAAAIVILGTAAFFVFRSVQTGHRPVATASNLAQPEKSIAVLPFENLSEEKANAYFADGIQNEILTRLAAVRDLKVISRTSAAKYQSKPDNLKTVAQELGVSTILEGAVQKAGDKVRVNVQLIDARADTHVWTKSYDRDFKDVLGVESEVSQEIAEALQANLSPSESHALASVRTPDAEAYDLFLRGEYEFQQAGRSLAADAFDRADAFYRQALARDPNFAEAAADLARSRLHRHTQIFPLTPAELEEVKSLIDRALALAPNSPEAHFALGLFYYWGYRDYDAGLKELDRVVELQPSSTSSWHLRAAINRRRGEWERSLADFRRAQELDPRDAGIPTNLGQTYTALRQWKDAERAELRALAIDPHNASAAQWLLLSRFNATGDVDWARRALDGFPEATNIIPRADVIGIGNVAPMIGFWVYFDVFKRRFSDAFQGFEKEVASDDRGRLQQLAGRAALRVLAGQTEPAKSAGEEARPLLEARLRERSDDTFAMTALSWVYLALGRNADALSLSRQAADLIPIEKDALAGPNFQCGLAQIEARAGAPEEAIKRLRRLLSIPAGREVSIARLKIDPVWDPIRNRPDFQQLLSGPEQIGPLTPSALSAVVPEKSIAVLPFENLSKGEENAFFAGGVQDEILTDLAKVADLKVISRTSVMKYKSDLERNLREIAKALGVSHVVEGSVQRTDGRVRVNVRLIDARNDTHLWAEDYDRDVADVFAIQTEVAQQIANQLQVKLSPTESAAIAERPTTDLVAFTYYTRANQINIYTDNWEGAEKNGNQKVELLEKAVQHDPNFVLAYCELVKTYLNLDDGAEQRKHVELAKKAADTALRLRPDLPEPHLALARYYWLAPDSILGVDREAAYDRARDELAIVRRMLPNNAEALLIDATIGRHQNSWDASLANLQRASELDPRNREVAYRLEQINFEMRRYSEFEQLIRKQAASGGYPLEDPFIQTWLAEMKLAQGDPVAAQSLLEQVPLEYSVWDTRFMAALYLRDYDAASRVIAATPGKYLDNAFGLEHGSENLAYGLVARARGDKEKAQSAFAAARQKIETTRGDKPEDATYFACVAKLDAGLGRKEEAVREALRAVELTPIAKDAVNGPDFIKNLALVYAWTGERDRALEQLEKIATIPGSLGMLTYGDLRFNPCWDDLRGDPRFDKIVAAAKAASK